MNKDTFLNLIQNNSCVSLHESLILDTETPISILEKFRSQENYVFLEGISEKVKYNRYSYLGFDPYITITCHDSHFELIYDDGKKEKKTGNFFSFLEKLLSRFLSKKPNNQASFYSGIMGNVCYEYLTHHETIDVPNKRSIGIPWAQFIIPKTVLIMDSVYNKVTIVRNVFKEAISDNEDAYTEVMSHIQSIKEQLYQPIKKPLGPIQNTVNNYDDISCSTNIDKETFIHRIKQCKEYIRSGDIFQIQVSRRAHMPIKEDPINLYRYLRNYNPSPLLFYIKFKDYTLLGASPEILVTVEDRKMVIRPLAGTRKRYSKEKTEKEICNELLENEKEKAEHIMLVDLARNDIGATCDIGSVHVVELMSIEKYAHVIHMVSEVEGKLKKEASSIDAFKRGFPAGTVTGTPKIRAMEIISEIENEQREFYSGGILFLDFMGNLKSTLAIRSILVKDGVAYTQAAAGIVSDSDPEDEFKETKNKMRSCLSAMHQHRATT